MKLIIEANTLVLKGLMLLAAYHIDILGLVVSSDITYFYAF
ncbi:hypothetical protein [Tenacibaculum sediminilitoris]